MRTCATWTTRRCAFAHPTPLRRLHNPIISIRNRLGRLGDDVLGRGIDIGKQSVDFTRRYRADIGLQLLSIGEELRVLHRGIEGGDQRPAAIVWNAGWSRIRTRHGLPGKTEADHPGLLFAFYEIHHGWNIRNIGLLA